MKSQTKKELILKVKFLRKYATGYDFDLRKVASLSRYKISKVRKEFARLREILDIVSYQVTFPRKKSNLKKLRTTFTPDIIFPKSFKFAIIPNPDGKRAKIRYTRKKVPYVVLASGYKMLKVELDPYSLIEHLEAEVTRAVNSVPWAKFFAIGAGEHFIYNRMYTGAKSIIEDIKILINKYSADEEASSHFTNWLDSLLAIAPPKTKGRPSMAGLRNFIDDEKEIRREKRNALLRDSKRLNKALKRKKK